MKTESTPAAPVTETPAPKAAKTPKAPKVKEPAHPWFKAVALQDSEGLHRGEIVFVRKSRDTNGKFPRYRILSATATVLISEPHIAWWVLGIRGTDGKPVRAKNDAKLDAHLQTVFKSQWQKAPGKVAA